MGVLLKRLVAVRLAPLSARNTAVSPWPALAASKSACVRDSPTHPGSQPARQEPEGRGRLQKPTLLSHGPVIGSFKVPCLAPPSPPGVTHRRLPPRGLDLRVDSAVQKHTTHCRMPARAHRVGLRGLLRGASRRV
jgi:hypothetical protein